MRYKKTAIYNDSEPLRKTIQLRTICHVWVACWLGAVWMGWAGWVVLAGALLRARLGSWGLIVHTFSKIGRAVFVAIYPGCALGS